MIGWQDLRNTEVTEDIKANISDDEHYAIEGASIGAFNAGVTVWVRKNEPERWKKVDRICTNQVFFLHELGAYGYYADVASTHRISMLDVDNNKWSDRLIRAYGFKGKKLPVVATEPGKIIGTIGASMSERIGLPVGCKICLGAQDVNCSSFGAGGTDSDISAMVCGTFGVSYIAIDKPVRDPNKTIVVKEN
jgi:sugar (pentulose or hexulose) kinase